MTRIRLTAQDGTQVDFEDVVIAQGGMKDVYFGSDRSYVCAFFRDKLGPAGKDRLASIVGTFRERILNQVGGDYWKNVFCWPQSIVEWNGHTGLVVPAYERQFFFSHGSVEKDKLGIRGREKEGKWFASASNRFKWLDPRERGTWLSYFRICILLSRAVRRLHAAGLAHSDLSYKNCLVDPEGGNACIIDIDGLVVPQKFPPDVVGTPDFIAPEVIATAHLTKNDPNRRLPSIATDRHALAVLIYMYLFLRHPLRGRKVHDMDPVKDEELSMGDRALFVEHPKDQSNHIRLDQARPSELPWADAGKLPYTIAGPLLAPLFLRAFTDGLQNPAARPTADEWEQALVKTVDLVQPCLNDRCDMKFYVFDNTTKPKCPFCGTLFRGQLPILNFYSARRTGSYTPDNHRLMVYSNQSLFPWHTNRNMFPNEKLSAEQNRRVGYFVFHNSAWYLVNERLPDLKNLTDNKEIPIGKHVQLKDNQQLLFSKQEGGRLAIVQLVSA